MFYLSRGCLEELRNKKSMFTESSGCSDDCNPPIIRLVGSSSLIVLVEEVVVLSNNLFGLDLYDGQSNLFVLIESLEHVTDDITKADAEHITHGTIIIINQLSIANESITDKLQKCNPAKEFCIVSSYIIIGHKNVGIQSEISNNSSKKIAELSAKGVRKSQYDHENLTESQALRLLETPSEDDLLSEVEERLLDSLLENSNTSKKVLEADFLNQNLKINLLTPSLSKIGWRVDCLLTKKSPRRSVDNRRTNNTISVIRLQLCDETSYIEIVAFGSLIERLENLEIGVCYSILNGEIKYSPENYRSWPNEKRNSQFDIIVNKNVKIIKTTSVILEPAVKVEEYKPIQSRMEKAKEKDSKVTYTQIKDLLSLKVDQLVNVMAIVYMLSDEKKKLNRDGKKPLKIYNFSIIDETKIFINVTLWGIQAEECRLQPGQVIILNKVKLTNYGGRSLSVLKFSEITVIPEQMLTLSVNPSTKADKLWVWWKQWFNKTLGNASINSILQKNEFKKRKMESDSEEESATISKQLKQN